MKPLVTVPAKLLRAAMPFMATKDVRFYLTGIHLNNVDGRIEATNGNMAFYVECKAVSELKEPLIIKPFGTIPPKAEFAEIYVNDFEDGAGKQGFIRFYNETGVYKSNEKHKIYFEPQYNRFFEVVTGVFPGFNKLIPNKAEKAAVDSMWLSTGLMAKIGKGAGEFLGRGMKDLSIGEFTFYGKDKLVGIEFEDYDGLKANVMLMPARDPKR